MVTRVFFLTTCCLVTALYGFGATSIFGTSASAQAKQAVLATTPESENLSRELRRRYSDFDEWSLDDIANRAPALAIDVFTGSISDAANWHGIIPKRIVREHGEEAPRLFMVAAYDRLAALNLYETPFVDNLRAAIKNNTNLTEAESKALVLDKPVTLTRTDGTTIQATPAQAMLHQISRAASDPALKDTLTPPPQGQPFFGALGGVLALPNSLLDALKRENPRLADRLETLRGKAILPVGPQAAYLAGQIGQLRGTNNIADWRIDRADAVRLCPQLPAIERDLTDLTRRDVRVDEALMAGAARASDLCPS